MYYMYNNKYFEHNRPNKDWSESPDLFTDKCDPEIQPYLDAILKKK